jgi:hypothetical protein
MFVRTRMVLASATMVLTGVLFAPTFSVGATVPPAPPVDTVPAEVIPVDDSVPDEQGIITDVVETTLPLNSSAATTIPAGCAVPMAPQMVFVGELLSIADTTATFRVIQVRAGTASGYINNDTVEVRYGQDTKFLDTGTRYIVGAASDPFSPLLVSKVRENSPLFGGDAVVGVYGSTGACPTLEDPVRTILENGTNIDTGVLRPLLENKLLIILAILISIAVVVGGLFALVLTRQVSRQASRGLRQRSARKKRTRRD